jgi:hypothetical protein
MSALSDTGGLRSRLRPASPSIRRVEYRSVDMDRRRSPSVGPRPQSSRPHTLPMTLGSRQRSPRTLVGSRRTPRNILADTVRLAAPTEEDAELPSQVPAIPLPRRAATLREIGRPLARVARHPQRDRVVTRRDRRPTRRWGLRYREVCRPILRRCGRYPGNAVQDLDRARHEPSWDQDGHLGTSSAIPFGWQRQPTRVRSYPRRCPPFPPRGEPLPFVRSVANSRGSRDILGEIVSPLVEIGSRLAVEDSYTERCATRSSEGTGPSSATPCRISTEIATNLRRIKTDTSEHPRRYRSVGSTNRRACAGTFIGSRPIPRNILGDTVRLAAPTEGGCARTFVGSRRTPRNILGDTVRLAAPTEEGPHEPSSDRDGHLGTSSAIPFGWERQPRRVRTNLRRIKTDTSERPRRYRPVGSANRGGCGATLGRCPPYPHEGSRHPFVRSVADAQG